ncbi:MAG: hypothetical protein GXP30_05560, partial [Verrucomicrobia bacterium]|nr:hypothetical protein [Verrucomicrobiota bacterium]
MIGVGLLGLGLKPQSADDKVDSGLKGRVVIVRIEDKDINDNRRFRNLRQLIADIGKAPAKAVVFDLNTGGGYTEEAARYLMEELPKVKVPSVAFVNPSALGAGAIIAMGSDEVYLSSVAVIGGAEPSGISASAVSSGNAGEKAEGGGARSSSSRVNAQQLSVLKAQARSLAKQKGHRPEVAQAFIDSGLEVIIGDDLISAKGELLTLTADEAVRKLSDGKTLFGKGVVASIEELLSLEDLGSEAKSLVYTPESYGEHLTQLRRNKPSKAKSKLTGEKGKADKDAAGGVNFFGKKMDGDYSGKILVVPVGMDDLMITARFEFMKRVLKKARIDGAEALIFDMNTPGGRVWETGELMMRELQEADFPTYTFVNTYAESGGCLVAIATDHIYMKPAALIGSALVVTSAGDLEGNMKQKVNEMLRDLVRGVAKLKGHDPDVAEAFVTTETKVVKDGIVISEMGKVLHLSTDEATMMVDGKPLLAKGVVNSIEEIIEREGLKGEVLNVKPLGLERFAHLIQRFSFLLIILGLAGAYMELNAPGFGVPGVTSLLAFGLFFFGNNLAGNLAGYELAVLLVLGLVLIGVEVFILPGTLLPGLAGGILVFSSLVLAMVDRFDFQFHWQDAPEAPSLVDLFSGPMMTLLSGLIGAMILGALLMRYIPTTRRLGGMILVESLPAGGALNENEGDLRTASGQSSYMGRKGVVSADLRPAGKGVFEGQLWDIVADGEFIEEGTQVKVIKH